MIRIIQKRIFFGCRPECGRRYPGRLDLIPAICYKNSMSPGVCLRKICLCLCLGVPLLLACSEQFDRTKFAGVDAAAKAVKGSVTAGDYRVFSARVQALSDEIAALKGRTSSKREEELLDAYAFLNSIYNDGVLLWRYKTEFTRYGFVPPGLIYVGQDIEPIVERYRLKTEAHVYAPTHQKWKSIPEDSIRFVWASADSQLQKIDFLLQE